MYTIPAAFFQREYRGVKFSAIKITHCDRFSNGPEWWRLRKIFQQDLNKIQNVRLYLSKSDQVIKNFLGTRIDKYKDDFLPELSRLYLEREFNTASTLRRYSGNFHKLLRFSDWFSRI